MSEINNSILIKLIFRFSIKTVMTNEYQFGVDG